MKDRVIYLLKVQYCLNPNDHTAFPFSELIYRYQFQLRISLKPFLGPTPVYFQNDRISVYPSPPFSVTIFNQQFPLLIITQHFSPVQQRPSLSAPVAWQPYQSSCGVQPPWQSNINQLSVFDILINQCLIPTLPKQCMLNHTNQFSQQRHRGLVHRTIGPA
jgi:hypothetical protein